MNNLRTHTTDTARAADELGASATLGLQEHIGSTGLVVVERYTAPADNPDLPSELMRMARQLDLIERRERHDSLSHWVLQWLEDQPALPSWASADRLDEELRALLTETIVTHNLITQVGDQYYGERASGIAGPPGQVTGMKLGTGSTAPAKTGAGAALVTYLSGSQKAIDGSFPTSSLNGSSRQIQWKTSWGAGVIAGSALREVVIINDVLADATSTAANTISRALFGPMTLGALDTLAITWSHLLLGA